MRRCGSESDTNNALNQQATQMFSHVSFTTARSSPKAMWKWAIKMIRQLTRGSSTGDAVMLLPEHWLEARHPSHRSHLKPYFEYWKNSYTKQSFFYWLDQGEGKLLDLPERPRVEVESKRVRYCGLEIALLEVCVEDGLLKYCIGKRLVHTACDESERVGTSPSATSLGPHEKPHKNKWIYVLDLNNRLYINKKQAGEFHHSSFTRGGPVRAAGSLQVDHGVIRQITGWSGHYRPKERDFDEMIGFLESQGVDMSQVEKFLTKMKPGSKMGQALDNSDDQQPLLCPCPMLLRRSAPVQSVYPGDLAEAFHGPLRTRQFHFGRGMGSLREFLHATSPSDRQTSTCPRMPSETQQVEILTGRAYSASFVRSVRAPSRQRVCGLFDGADTPSRARPREPPR